MRKRRSKRRRTKRQTNAQPSEARILHLLELADDDTSWFIVLSCGGSIVIDSGQQPRPLQGRTCVQLELLRDLTTTTDFVVALVVTICCHWADFCAKVSASISPWQMAGPRARVIAVSLLYLEKEPVAHAGSGI